MNYRLEKNEPASTDKPLVTFALFSYNQEDYIREAVEGALSQTYSPLQIIISDDCSKDSTFKIIEEAAANYSGPHQIQINQNKTNNGFAEHINHVMNLAKGDLVVMAAGDDISAPERVSTITSEWLRLNRQPGVIYSNIDIVNKKSEIVKNKCHIDYTKKYNDGNALEYFLNHPFSLGCSYSVCAKLWKSYPRLNKNLINEDFIFPFRSLLSSKPIKYIDKCLVKYRVDEGVGHGNKPNTDRSKSSFKKTIYIWEQILSDLKYRNPSSNKNIDFAKKRLNTEIQKEQYCRATFIKSIVILLKMEISSNEKLRFYISVNHPKLARFIKKFFD